MQTSQELFSLVCQKIEEEREKAMDRLIGDFAGLLMGTSTEKPDRSEQRKHALQESIAKASLYCLKICLAFNLADEGKREYLEDFSKDFDSACQSVAHLYYTFADTPTAISGTVGIIQLLDPQCRHRLMQMLPLATRRKARDTLSVQEAFPFLREMLRYYFSNGFRDAVSAMVENMVLLSEKQNGSAPAVHRDFIWVLLEYLTDWNADLTVKICTQQQRYFENNGDGCTGMFYWYWASALLWQGNFSEARPLLLRCSRIAFALEGETSWTGSLANANICLIDLSKDDNCGEAYLWDFIHKVDSGYFPDAVPEYVRIISGNARYRLLSFHRDHQNLRLYWDELQALAPFIEEYDSDPQLPLLKKRPYYNLLTEYYLEVGDFLRASELSDLAMAAVSPEGTPQLLKDRDILSNQLLLTFEMFDFDRGLVLRNQLAAHLDDEDLKEKDRYRFQGLITFADYRFGLIDRDDIASNKRIMSEIAQNIRLGIYHDPQACNQQIVTLVVAAVLVAVSDSTTAERKQYSETLRYFLSNAKNFHLSDFQIDGVNQSLATIYLYLRDPQAIPCIEACLQYCRSRCEIIEINTEVLWIAALIYHSMGQLEQADRCAAEALGAITKSWQKATTLLNDRRISQMLLSSSSFSTLCYTLRRPNLTDVQRYEYVLRYKDLPALAARERNRILQTTPTDSALRTQIFALQDRIAAMEASRFFRSEESIDELYTELQHLEAQFARQFPEAKQFTEISYDRVAEAIPDRTAVVEYYFSFNPSCFDDFDDNTVEDELALEIFVTVKRVEKAELHVITIPHANEIAEWAESFLAIMSKEAGAALLHQKTPLREKLFRALLLPVLHYLADVDTLCLAPDLTLGNLPFELLYADGCARLAEQFRVIRLVSGRDLLFFDDQPGYGGALVFGDPDYEAERGEIISGETRSADFQDTFFSPLPYSKKEAEIVAKYCRTLPYTGKAATKYVLQNAGPCRIIHLATHGCFDRSLESDSLFSSCLAFAGANRWYRDGSTSRYFGNGILTADEISRLRLRSTDLVVLSACQSGMGGYEYSTMHGLLSAFSAAGVRWAVSHIWSASDFAAPIFMEAFYRAHLKMGMDIPEALQYGKQRLRTITVAELRREGWLDGSDEDAQKIGRRSDDHQPFNDEYYWSGFILHKFR